MKLHNFYFLIICMVHFCGLKAILDGRVAPIYLENRYTFTNFEWARGNVYFEKGFDLPTNGTAFIGINQEVGGDIRFNKSTLSLLSNLALSFDASMTGSGFINAQGKTIFFKNNWFFQAYETFIITSDVKFQGFGGNALRLQGAFLTGGLSVNQGVNFVEFRRFNFGAMYGNNFTTKSGAPLSINFIDCSIALEDNVTFNSNQVYVSGNVQFLKSNKTLTVTNLLRIEFFTTLLVQSQTTLKVGKIGASEISSQLILENAKLSYTPTGTYSLFFNKTFLSGPHQGSLIIRGKSELLTPNGVELFLTKQSSITFDTGSLLKIRSGTKLTIS